MWLGTASLVIVYVATSVHANPVGRDAHRLAHNGAALANLLRRTAHKAVFERDVAPNTAPSGNYAPSVNQTCPSTLIRRPSTGANIYEGERDWVASRRANAVSHWSSYLNNSALNFTASGFNLASFLSNTSNLPNVAIAASGGGYRAMIHAAALVNAFDARNTTSVQQGTGGILQLATYISGLSGGSWFVGSLAVNNFPTIFELRNIWDLTENLADPGGLIDLFEYYKALHDEVDQKANEGFDVSLTDYWGRALSRHLVNNTGNGLATTFSSIQTIPSFLNHTYPFPIIIADSRRQGETIIPVNTSIYEYTPFEFGSWNPNLQAFIPMQYLGTSAVNGTVNATRGCVVGYDNMGFVMGTSATLFNLLVYRIMASNSTVASLLGPFLKSIDGMDDDIATYPNPFQGLNMGTYADATELDIDLVDGGEDNENVPLWPLIHPERQVDVILSLDASADTTYSWPNGSSLVETRNRMLNEDFARLGNYPQVPADTNTFVNRGLNARTTFFGCTGPISNPLIVYIPNAPYTSYTNFSTFQLSYTDLERDSFLENGFREARGNSITLTSTTPALPFCLACALVSRAERRAGVAQTPQCAACFNAYCWDGIGNSSTPSEYNPSIPGLNPANQPGGAGTNEHPTPSTSTVKGAAAVRTPTLSPLALIFAVTGSGLGVLIGSLMVL